MDGWSSLNHHTLARWGLNDDFKLEVYTPSGVILSQNNSIKLILETENNYRKEISFSLNISQSSFQTENISIECINSINLPEIKCKKNQTYYDYQIMSGNKKVYWDFIMYIKNNTQIKEEQIEICFSLEDLKIKKNEDSECIDIFIEN